MIPYIYIYIDVHRYRMVRERQHSMNFMSHVVFMIEKSCEFFACVNETSRYSDDFAIRGMILKDGSDMGLSQN